MTFSLRRHGVAVVGNLAGSSTLRLSLALLFSGLSLTACSSSGNSQASNNTVAANTATNTASTATPTVKTVADPAARKAVDEMIKAYGKLKTFSSTMQVQMTAGGVEQPGFTRRVVFKYRAPDRVRVEVTANARQTLAIGNKNMQYITNSAYPKLYVQRQVPKVTFPDIVALAQGVSPGIVQLMQGIDPLVRSTATLKSLIISSAVDGTEEVTAVYDHDGKTERVVLLIGRKDHLLRQMTLLGEKDGKPMVYSETHTNPRANVSIPDSAFKFVPPDGFVGVSEFPRNP